MDQRIIDLYDEFTHTPLDRRTFMERLAILTGSAGAADGRIGWFGGSALLGQLIDLDPLIGAGAVSRIAGIAGAQALDLPVLADHDAACARWTAHQYLPLGDDRLVIRKLPRADNLVAQHTPLEALLSTLLAD